METVVEYVLGIVLSKSDSLNAFSTLRTVQNGLDPRFPDFEVFS